MLNLFRLSFPRISAAAANKKRGFWHSPYGKALGWTAGSLLLTGAGAFLYAGLTEARRYGLEHVNINTGDNQADGSAPGRQLRILHLSDLHLHGDDEEKAQFLRRVTDDDYDIVVLTGDVFEKYSGIKFAHTLLSRPPRIGAFAVLGNHDYYDYSMVNKVVGRMIRPWRTPQERRNVEPMIGALKEIGFHVLQHQALAVPEHELLVVGIDWPGIGEDHLKELIADAPDHYFRLCLFHLPKKLEYIERARMHLAVGGHTHGGQIRIPGVGAIITDSDLPRRQASGLMWRGKTAIHVSRGLSADPRTNFRIFCPPAVTVLNVVHY